MPIMDGFEACRRIYSFCQERESDLINLVKEKKEAGNKTPLIYALTSDLCD